MVEKVTVFTLHQGKEKWLKLHGLGMLVFSYTH